MIRDLQTFPQDTTGETLWQLAKAGDDLSVARDVEFFLAFPSEDDALDCGCQLLKNQYKLQLSTPSEGEARSSWTLEVTEFMVPLYADINEHERFLQQLAAHVGGECTGWGCVRMGAP